jgi:hypothetical protein
MNKANRISQANIYAILLQILCEVESYCFEILLCAYLFLHV